jgi:hypothetical protein
VDTYTAAGKLVMQWDEGLFSFESRGDDEGYLLNHSCDSSICMLGAHTLVARRDIDTSEELVAVYALWESDEQFEGSWIYKCGSAQCRNIVNWKDWGGY